MNLTSAVCPDCSIEAHNKREVENLFGFRNFRDHEYVQSWCRECRSRERRENRLGK